MPKQYTLLRITCFFWLIAKLLSMKAWMADRLYPVVPVFEFTDTVSPALHSILFYISCVCMAVLFVFPKRNDIPVFLLIAEITSCLLDVTRWQPWEYQYIFTLLLFVFSRDNPKRLYSGFIFLFASIYIFSGLHKLNGGFLYTIWESMILRRFLSVSTTTITDLKLHYAGLLLPLIEIVCGLALLLFKNKKWPALVLIGMHSFILVFIGPFGINYNIVVWPWNAAMILLLYTLFINQMSYNFSFGEMVKGCNGAIVVFWGILPIFSFTGQWDQYLSSSLYSGSLLNMDVCVADKNKVPQLNSYFSTKDKYCICNGDARIVLQDWAFKEMRVPPYPEEWYYKRFKKQWEKKYGTNNARFILYAYPFKEKKEME
ncbi:hypothetical protein AAEO56_10105 [Flavobacterium sp. DGU11]|uniref:Vitamin K-dependent gamma-carboxylase n=1 Tax=Flavobacterium arundinis TaxID=3139143 RepID=A0ABU9HXV3_9FLAO